MTSAEQPTEAPCTIGGWVIRPDPADAGLHERWFARAWSGSECTPATVPSTWQRDIASDADQPSGVAWYRARITAPAPESSPGTDQGGTDRRRFDRWWVRFESVATDCSAWASGVPIGRHVGDYLPFAFELPRETGASPRTELTLRVDRINAPRPERAGDLQRGHITKGFKDVISLAHAGVWGEVSVRRTGPLALEPDGVGALVRCAHARDDAGDAQVEIVVNLERWPDIPTHRPAGGSRVAPNVPDRAGLVRVTLHEWNGGAQRAGGKVSSGGGGEGDGRGVAGGVVCASPVLASAAAALEHAQREARLTLTLSQAKLWSPERPALYAACVELFDADGRVSDREVVRFGVRHVGTGFLMADRPDPGARRAESAASAPPAGSPATPPVADGPRLLLNGRPIYLSGVLEWGHEPAHGSPSPTRDEARERFRRLKALGFNCVCLCMVYPPRWFYDEADEAGMLLWQEHPVWQSRMDDADLSEYRRLYSAFFRRDRNHPSVVVVSATCEHPAFHPALAAWWWEASARELPGVARQVQTASFAWADLARTDLYDEHTYEHSNRWDEYLHDVRAHISALSRVHGPRPFVMGETALYTSWPDVAALRRVWDPARAGAHVPSAGAAGAARTPREFAADWSRWWLPRGFEEYIAFEDSVRRDFGDTAVERMRRQGDRFHLLGRKFQIERFRLSASNAGLVMNHVRDVPQARCGFIGDDGEWRFTPDQTRGWLGPCAAILDTPDRCFGFFTDELDAGIPCRLAASNFGRGRVAGAVLRVGGAEMRIPLECAEGEVRTAPVVVHADQMPAPGVAGPPAPAPAPPADVRPIDVEATLEFRASAHETGGAGAAPAEASAAVSHTTPATVRNSWRLWALDRASIRRELADAPGVVRLVTPPLTDAERAWDDSQRGYSRGFGLPVVSATNRTPDPAFVCPELRAVEWDAVLPPPDAVRVIVANRLSRSCIPFVLGGGSVVLLAGKQAGSVPTRYEWLFGQTPLIVERPALLPGDSDWITDLLQVDLVRRHCRVMDVDELGVRSSIEPIVRLVYTHDQSRPRAFDLCFWARVGTGTLVVSTLDHSTAAGRFMLARLVAFARRAADRPESIASSRELDPRVLESWAFDAAQRAPLP